MTREWDASWRDQAPTLTARTMTNVLDRVKWGYLRSILPPVGRTLEVGCGSARLSCFLAMAGYRTVGLDSSVPALELARRNYAVANARGLFVVGDGLGLPFPDGVFDVVLSTGLLEHFPDPAPIVAEMVRVLRPAGLFYSDIVPRKFSLFRSLDWLGRLRRTLWRGSADSEGFYERAFTGDEIADLLRGCGLPDPRVFAAGVVPPYLPLLYRSRRLREAEVRLVEATQALWRRLDGTRVAERLGFYYFAWATKP
jgi:SAM-dependent methyltransferase